MHLSLSDFADLHMAYQLYLNPGQDYYEEGWTINDFKDCLRWVTGEYS